MTLRPLLAIGALLVAFPAFAEGFPVVVTHVLGNTTILAKPVRVVSIGYNDQDFLYALGVAPVAVHEWWGGQPYATYPWAEAARKALNATPEVLASPELNFEWVAAQNPDLIVATYYDLDTEAYEELSRIAPVVASPAGYDPWGAPWQKQLELLDEATSGSVTAAKRIEAKLDANVTAARIAHPELVGRTGIMADYRDGEYVVWSKTFPPQRFLADLGLTFPAALDGRTVETDEIHLSPEDIHLLDLDVVVWPNSAEADITALPLYGDLRLAKQRRSVFPEGVDPILAAALWWQTPLSVAYAIDRFPSLLESAVDGDPSTP